MQGGAACVANSMCYVHSCSGRHARRSHILHVVLAQVVHADSPHAGVEQASWPHISAFS